MSEHTDAAPPFTIDTGFRLMTAFLLLALVVDVLRGGGVVTSFLDTPALTVATFWHWVLSIAKLVAQFTLGAFLIVSVLNAVVSAVQAARTVWKYAT